MIPPLDPFAQSFDSIEIDPARTPSQAAIESAFEAMAPREELLTPSAAAPEFASPGFYLLADADGRFVVDRDMGVVSLADDTLLEREPGAVHGVRMRVVEQSGAAYELEMQLRVTGHVPQMVGAEEFAAIASLAGETVIVATRVPALVVAPTLEPSPGEAIGPAQVEWTRFAPAQAHAGRLPRVQPRRGFIAPEFSTAGVDICLDFAGSPVPIGTELSWSI